MNDVICIGEMLVDLIPTNRLEGESAYFAKAGGAPANVAVVLACLGHSVSFAGQVGADSFGRLCGQYLSSSGVDTSLLDYSNKYITSIAVVGLGAQGEREFTFYRHPAISADIHACYSAKTAEVLSCYRMLHFGSVSLSDEPAREETMRLVRRAHGAGKIISFDPNIRPSLWANVEAAAEACRNALPYVHVLKLTQEELSLLCPGLTMNEACKRVQKEAQIPLVLVTCGKDGCYAMYNGRMHYENGFKVRSVDTTGAGDCFQAAALHFLLEQVPDLNRMSEQQVHQMLRMANASGALAVTKFGATSGVSRIEDIQDMLLQSTRPAV